MLDKNRIRAQVEMDQLEAKFRDNIQEIESIAFSYPNITEEQHSLVKQILLFICGKIYNNMADDEEADTDQ